MGTTEQTFNEGLGEFIEDDNGLPSRCIFTEKTQKLKSGAGKKVDVLLLPDDAPPVAIETEWDKPGSDPTIDAVKRLGDVVVPENRTIEHAIALSVNPTPQWGSPSKVKVRLQGRKDSFKYKLLTGASSNEYAEFPPGSWIESTASGLLSLLRSITAPYSEIAQTSKKVTEEIIAISEDIVNNRLQPHKADQIALETGQTEASHGIRVACVLWLDALLMQDKLSSYSFPNASQVQSRNSYISKSSGTWTLDATTTISEWENIINNINYNSIFTPALNALRIPSGSIMSEVLGRLHLVADEIEKAQLGSSVNLGGEIFGRVLQDRKDIAAFYTKLEIADLLASLTIHEDIQLPDVDISLQKTGWKLGDFACGTGTLLQAGYRRLAHLAHMQKIERKNFHKEMLTEGICGVDISTIASHLTATSLVSLEPSVVYGDTNIGVLPLKDDNGLLHSGAVELLVKQPKLIHSGRKTKGMAKEDMEEQAQDVDAPDETFHAIMMNPPYKRATKGSPMFYYPGLTPNESAKIRQKAKLETKRTEPRIDWQAGLGSVFSVLANQKLAEGGRIGLVLPMSAAYGSSWASVRKMFEDQYRDLLILFMAGASRGGSESLSADTKMGEIILVGTKSLEGREHIAYVAINEPLTTSYEGTLIADSILEATLSAEPGDAGVLEIGDHPVGHWILRKKGQPVWKAAGICDLLDLFVESESMISGVLGTDLKAEFPTTSMGELFDVGPTHHVIGHRKVGKSSAGAIGAFAFHKIKDTAKSKPKYISLWETDNDIQTSILCEATHYGILRQGQTNAIWDKRGDLFLQRNMRWTTQKILSAVTTDKMLGSGAWGGLRHENKLLKAVFALWCNSTLGMITIWAQANKRQSGRINIPIKAMKLLKCPNFDNKVFMNRFRKTILKEMKASNVSDIEMAKYLCTQYCQAKFLPANQAEYDVSRQQIDKFIAQCFADDEIPASDIEDFTTRLRKLWVREPSVMNL